MTAPAVKAIRWNWRMAFVWICAAAGFYWAWGAYVKDHMIPKRWGVVEQGAIYRSGQLSKEIIKPVLVKNNIRVVIDLTAEEAGNPDQKAEKQAVAELGIEYLRFPLSGDGRGEIRNYAEAVAAIVRARQSGRPVLIHCAAGSQRTGGVVAAYRLLVENRQPEEVYAELKQYEWRPRRNRVLLDYLNGNMGRLAGLLVEMGVLAQAPDPVPLLNP